MGGGVYGCFRENLLGCDWVDRCKIFSLLESAPFHSEWFPSQPITAFISPQVSLKQKQVPQYFAEEEKRRVQQKEIRTKPKELEQNIQQSLRNSCSVSSPSSPSFQPPSLDSFWWWRDKHGIPKYPLQVTRSFCSSWLAVSLQVNMSPLSDSETRMSITALTAVFKGTLRHKLSLLVMKRVILVISSAWIQCYILGVWNLSHGFYQTGSMRATLEAIRLHYGIWPILETKIQDISSSWILICWVFCGKSLTASSSL